MPSLLAGWVDLTRFGGVAASPKRDLSETECKARTDRAH